MTWIVGTVTPFGESILVSDVCVTWPNGVRKDCLQKIHKVGDDILCEIAGSVRIGFAVLDILATQLPAKQSRGLQFIIQDWIPSLGRRIFAAAPPGERSLSSQLIIAAAHPTETLGEAPFPRTFVWTFSYPRFEPLEATYENPLGIGSGSVVPTYVTAVRDTCRNPFFFQLITHGRAAQANHLAMEMHKAANRDPTKGVSSLFQIGLLTRGEALFKNFGYTQFDANGKATLFQLPPIAKTYGEFENYCRNGRLNAVGAGCRQS